MPLQGAGIETIRVNKSGCMEALQPRSTMAILSRRRLYTYNSEAGCREIIATHLQGGLQRRTLSLAHDLQSRGPNPSSRQCPGTRLSAR